eukprot:349595-Chlamydomonas_euryale.AAC.3
MSESAKHAPVIAVLGGNLFLVTFPRTASACGQHIEGGAFPPAGLLHTHKRWWMAHSGRRLPTCRPPQHPQAL